MTDKEKIIAEIERLYNTEAERFDTSQEIGAKRILDKLDNFINSLPAEQPNEVIYEQKYKEALEMAKFIKKNADDEGTIYIGKFFLENIFPELKKTKEKQ